MPENRIPFPVRGSGIAVSPFWEIGFQAPPIKCGGEAVEAPNPIIGIVEAAWWVKPNFILLTLELQETLCKSGLRELRARLGEVSRCMRALFRNGPTIQLGPCTTTKSPDQGQVIPLNFSGW